ncbi:hypothetical protein [Deinococcus sp. UR1]|uniref:hypothetical protein n=1 Tax=Deinococcus sp. UR1 TaxID=1704277 RepID=UPI0006DC3FD0|nr:hypothetical protein [Deinococcus sp. UR1]PIG98870.1 hypothetical protein AMD26_006320 [Deinococcus sp. UR1]
MTQVKFGRQLNERAPFEVNGLVFSGLPLSLSEERVLAGAGDGGSEVELMDAVLEVLSQVLNVRAHGERVDTAWLLENLAPSDVEGILDYLRATPVS